MSERHNVMPTGNQDTQIFTHTNISGHARVHMGNVFNFGGPTSTVQGVLEWLKPIDPSSSHNQACIQFQEGTLNWFFEDTTFQSWRDRRTTSSPQLLWCRGGIGAGKTTLVSQVLAHLHGRGVPRENLAVAYCRQAEQSVQTAANLLISLLMQLYQHEQGLRIPPTVEAAYKSLPYFRKERPSERELQHWLNLKVEVEGPIFVLLDALDEMKPLFKQKLLRLLQSTPHLKLLVTSRYAPDAESGFPDIQELEFVSHERDIATLVNARLAEEGTEKFRRLISQAPGRGTHANIQQEISWKVVASANNMFLHASLHLDNILVCANLDEIYHCLNQPLLGLDSLYDQAWTRAVDGKGSLRSQRARLVLMWLTMGDGEMSTDALKELLSVSGVGAITDAHLENQIISSCAGFVRIESAHSRGNQLLSKVTFTHLSGYRYLQERRELYFPGSYEDMVAVCLSSLRSHPDKLLRALPQSFAFIAYGPLSIFYLSSLLRNGLTDPSLCVVWVTTLLICLDVWHLTPGPPNPKHPLDEFAGIHLERYVKQARLVSKWQSIVVMSKDPVFWARVLIWWSFPLIVWPMIIDGSASPVSLPAPVYGGILASAWALATGSRTTGAVRMIVHDAVLSLGIRACHAWTESLQQSGNLEAHTTTEGVISFAVSFVVAFQFAWEMGKRSARAAQIAERVRLAGK